MDYQSWIQSDPKVLGGKPAIKGTRIAVDFILEQLAKGMTVEEMVDTHHNLDRVQVMACLGYAASVLRNETVHSIEIY